MSAGYGKRIERLIAGQHVLSSRLRTRADNEHLELEAAYDAVQEGSATLRQYARLISSKAKSERKQWQPTVTLGLARRRLGLEVGHRLGAAGFSYLPGDVLSHPPTEPLAREVRSELQRVDEILSAKRSDPDLRARAALTRLVLGPGEGLKMRGKVWSTGEEAARTRFCDYQYWRNNCILPMSVWEELDTTLRRRREEAGEAVMPLEHHLVTVYEAYERLLYERFGDGGPPVVRVPVG